MEPAEAVADLDNGRGQVYESASSPLVGFGGLNDNIIKGLISLPSVEQEIELLHTLVDCVMRSVSKIQQEDKLDGIPHSVEMKAKLCIIVLEDHGNNLVQAKDNNANGVDEMTSMLRDIIVSCESNHIWQMTNET